MNQSELQKLTALACLDPKDAEEKLGDQINQIIDFVTQLKEVNTTDIAPLYNPSPHHQRLRKDEVTEEACLSELEALTPYFSENLYWVPKVINSGN